MILSIDIGNTFTDFVFLNEQGWRTHKIFSTPGTPEDVFLKGVDAFGLHDVLQQGNLLVVHNSHVESMRALLENYDVKSIYVTNHSLPAIQFFSQLTKQPALLTFNMGGHSSQFSLFENNHFINEGHISVGGGSIAYLDEQQALQINSTPNTSAQPVCYGVGGDQPTITDANLILGRLRPNTILGNALRPDINSARMALATIAGKLNMRIEEVAHTIVNMANEKIVTTLRAALSKHTLPQITLCATGGGALHVCAVADALNIKNVVVPLFGGVFSAFGGLVATKSNVSLPALAYKKERASHERIALYGITLPVSVWNRNELSPEEMIMGPAIIMEETTTTFLQNGWLAYVDEVGNLLLRRMAIDVY